MNRQQIRDIARKRLGETTSAFWTDTELNTYINLGCKDVSWRIKCLRSTGYISLSSCEQNTTAAGVTEWVMTTELPNAYAVNEVYFQREGSEYIRLDPTTREELDVLDESWQSLVGRTYLDTNTGTTYYNYESNASEPTHYYWSREEDMIGIYPPPNDNHDGASLKIYFSLEHTDLSTDTDEPQLPSGIHLSVIDYVVASGLEDRGWGDRANDQWNKYKLKLKEYQTEKRVEREDDLVQMKNYKNI